MLHIFFSFFFFFFLLHNKNVGPAGTKIGEMVHKTDTTVSLFQVKYCYTKW